MTTTVDKALTLPDRATQEASHWLIALQDEPDDALLADRFAAWLTADPRHEAAWAEIRQVYRLIGETEPAFEPHWVLPTASEPPQIAPPSVTRYGWRHLIASTAALLLAAGAWMFGPTAMTRLTADYSTAAAEIRTIDLADGSKVWLGPDSALDVAWFPNRREVHLRAGEAFFEVAPDAQRPFSVDMDGVKTTVLGTAFDVRRDAYGVEIAVQHGKVRVASGNQVLAAQLTAGQWLRTGLAGEFMQGQRPVGQIGAWKQRQLIAQNQTVAEIVDRVRPYFPGVIILGDEGLAERRLTGIYNLADPVSALEAIARGHNGVVKHLTPWILVLSPG